MKYKTLIIVLVVFVILSFLAFHLYNKIFPLAKPLSLISKSSVTSFIVEKDSGEELENIGLDEIISSLEKAKPTRIMTVNDYPEYRPYYKVDISTESSHYRYFFYSTHGKNYVEIPYFGVYVIE